jgi:hypothetical protein
MIDKLSSNNLYTIFVSLAALIFSGMLVTSAYLFLAPRLGHNSFASSDNDSTKEIIIRGAQLDLILGTGISSARDSFVIQGLAHLPESDARAILSRRIHLSADKYPFLQYKITGLSPGQHVYLLWRTRDDPEQVYHAPLGVGSERSSWINLSGMEEWQGTITEIALDVYGELRGQNLEVHALELKPYSALALASVIYSEWVTPVYWTQKSVNFLRVSEGLQVTVSPTLALAAWSGLTILLILLFGRPTRYDRRSAIFLAVFVPWISLDLIWQNTLSKNLEETQYLFSGKNQHQKHLADSNSELFEYIDYLKRMVLPEPGVRIFLLHDSPAETYTRLKAQYYLLPHNVFNFDRFPERKSIKDGDYILVLGEVSGLAFSAERSALEWRGKSLAVKLIDNKSQGNLYRVEKKQH